MSEYSICPDALSKSQEFDLVRRSAFRRVLDIAQLVARLGAANKSPKEIATLYSEDLVLADASEKVTPNMVECALRVHQKILAKSTAVLEMIAECDNRYGLNSPIDSVIVLNTMVAKVGSNTGYVSKFEWMLNLMLDLFEFEKLKPEDFSKRALNGSGTPPRGTVDVALAKLEIKGYLSWWAGEELGNPAAAEQLRLMTTNAKEPLVGSQFCSVSCPFCCLA